jgi:epoxide hydrolase-like predicted phosphatase
MEPNMSGAIQAVLWDLGGVIVRTHDWSARSQWEKRLGLAPHELEQIVYHGEIGQRAAIGKATENDVFDWVAEHFEMTEAERRQFPMDFWGGDQVDAKLVDQIRRLRARYKSGLISNAWPELRHYIQEVWAFADAFDEMVISAEVGLVKPDARIYRLMLTRMDLLPEQAVFIDDFEENVEGARAVGMRAIRFESHAQALGDLGAMLGTLP